VDLADLGSVRKAAAQAGSLGPIDVLVNNAGVMAPPYSRTVDGLESQLATNHFGPFLLTGLLLPQLVASNAARVVTVSSQMHRVARQAPLGDPRVKQGRYSRWQAYAETKLANLLFTFELQRRLTAGGSTVRAVAVHPGMVRTNLFGHRQVLGVIIDFIGRFVMQDPAHGARATLFAATQDIPGGSFVQPDGFGHLRGVPAISTAAPSAYDAAVAGSLWALSAQLTGTQQGSLG
jgi:NAD(P)-dependent dehydrogenase (short-subunit alcohol dehydrogenase family)